LDGELTIYTVAATKRRFEEHLRGRRTYNVDLSAVTEIDAAGIQLLLWAKQMAEARGRRFRVTGCSATVAEAIGLLHLGDAFKVGASRQE
jgi:anti-anti-sigma factor